ncbi:MAG: D-3-phosphoglycerate dehydrogenase [Bacteroidota bacterium]|jgi:D-3-phosphoglycerate dehydrogenase
MNKPVVLLIDTLHPAFIDTLTQHGVDYIEGYHLTKEEILESKHLYNGMAIRSRFKLDESFLNSLTNTVVIGRAGAGMENIDAIAATSNKIELVNAPEGNKDAVGEHAIGMLLALNNHLIRVNQEVRNGIWRREENRGVEIQGKTIAVIGFGNMGRAFAKKLQGFESNIIVYDPYIKISKANFPYVSQVDLEAVFNEADIISLHIPLTEETNQMVNERFLNSFKKEITVINTARGKVVNTQALVNAMKEGKVKYAALDVIEYESISFENLDTSKLPEAFQYLIKSDRVLLSPHIAGWTLESNTKIATTLANKMIEVFKGRKLL